MRIFVKNIREQDIVFCPFNGFEWDGSYENMSEILRNKVFTDGKVLPFVVNCIETNLEIIVNRYVSHPEAEYDHVAFLFENKKLVCSGKSLSDLFSRYEKYIECLENSLCM